MSEKINERLFDLVRYMRVELHEEGLITDREYAWLASEAPPSIGLESPSPRRLENYDEMQAALDHTRYALRNVAEIADKGAADPETTLGQIYDAATRRPPSFGSVEWHDTLGVSVEQFNEDVERLNWLEQFLQLGGSSVSTLSTGSVQDPREDDTDATRWNHDFSIGYSAETEHRGIYTWKELSDGSRSIRKAIDGAKRASERQCLKYGIGKLADKEEEELRMAHEIDQLRGALLAMRDHYRQWSIPGTLHNQVEAALSLSNVQSAGTEASAPTP
jgi:hypothetical protein